jgi:hypothetical protein
MMQKEVGESEVLQWYMMDRKSRSSTAGDVLDAFNAHDLISQALEGSGNPLVNPLVNPLPAPSVQALTPKLTPPAPAQSLTEQQHSIHHAHHKRKPTRHGHKHKHTKRGSSKPVEVAPESPKETAERQVLLAPRLFAIPGGLKLVAEGLCILLGIDPDAL